MVFTQDQYDAVSKLHRWYHKYSKQYIELSGHAGTGVFDVVQDFIDNSDLEQREVMYLSFDQKNMLTLAQQGLHSYYIYGALYNYIRVVDFDTIPVINSRSTGIKCEWKKQVRKLDSKYKLIVIIDSLLIDELTLSDICSWGAPVILIRDPMLLPVTGSIRYLIEPEIIMNEVNSKYLKNPIIHFANLAVRGDKFTYGSYDTVSVVPKKQLNIYNLKSSDMTISVSNELADTINTLYRDRVLNQKTDLTVVGERVIVDAPLYNEKLVDSGNKKVKVYLTKGLTGKLTKVNKHASVSKYVSVNFTPDCYPYEFEDLALNRHHLNKTSGDTKQQIPDYEFECSYAYALPAANSRVSTWDKVTVIADAYGTMDNDLYRHLLYTAITRSDKSLTLVV